MPSTKYLPITFTPGVNRDTTSYGSEGTWYETDKVRWRNGYPQTIGGWQKRNSINVLDGVPRTLVPWSTRQGDRLLAIGTNEKVYIEKQDTYNDITPVSTSASYSNNLTMALGATSVVVAASAHTRAVNDYVYISAANTIGGVVDLTGNTYRVSSIIDNNTFVIDTTVTATTPTSAGGGSVSIDYLVASGKPTNTLVFGYGSGGYGEDGYGEPSLTGVIQSLRRWNIETWGEDLLLSFNGGALYHWDATDGVFVRAVLVSTAPSVIDGMFVDPTSRQVVALGTQTEVGSVYDPMLIRWSSSEDYTDWVTLPTNTAGELPLQEGSKIVGHQKTKGETLIWTDQALFSFVFAGTEGFTANRLGLGCGLIGPNASVDVGGAVYWMGPNGFWRYDGSITPLSCTLQKDIFDYDGEFSINRNQVDKVFGGHNSQFKEIIWFYQSSMDEHADCDSYVIYNYQENIWYYGTFDRTSWLDIGILDNPIATSHDGYIYEHELGLSNNNEPFTTKLVSTEFDISEGDEVMFIDRIVPDLSLVGSVDVYLNFRKYPQAPVIRKGPYSFSSNNIEQNSVKDMRARGRQVSLEISSNALLNSSWQLGKFRLRVKPDGHV